VGQPGQELPNDLLVTVGKSVLVDSSLPIERVAVGFGDIAEATAVGPREVLLNGKAPGATSLIIWQQGGNRLWFDVTVRASRFLADTRVEAIDRQIKVELPGQNVTLRLDNDTVFLRGTVKDRTSADRAVSIASTLGKTVNLLYVDVPPPDAQILLKVKFASVDRNVSTALGMNIFSTGATKTIGSVTTQQFSPPGFGPLQNSSRAVTTTLSDALNLFFFRPDLNLGATIQALETRGLLQVLAEPNLLASDGKQASFLAGGEFPFPTVQGATGGGAASVTIQFQEFGVRLNFIPTIMPRGTIRLQVAPEVSALDFTNGLSVSGFNVPALTIRKVNTEVELGEGQSFAIGGLLDNRMTAVFEKIPFLGDLPIIGKFFQSKSRNKQNTELLVIVTPELVRPVPAGQPVPELKYPKPFLEPNTGKDWRTPGTNTPGSVPVRPPDKPIPIETLMQSLRPETPLSVQPQKTAAPAPNSPSQ
jgi:pilus assembly protein CpaC